MIIIIIKLRFCKVTSVPGSRFIVLGRNVDNGREIKVDFKQGTLRFLRSVTEQTIRNKGNKDVREEWSVFKFNDEP
jgi:hypothetical protein